MYSDRRGRAVIQFQGPGLEVDLGSHPDEQR